MPYNEPIPYLGVYQQVVNSVLVIEYDGNIQPTIITIQYCDNIVCRFLFSNFFFFLIIYNSNNIYSNI